MKLCFDSIEEVKEFVKQLKGTRGGKDKDEGDTVAGQGQAPAPIMPPQGAAFNPGGFAPQGQPAAPQAGAFPAAGAPVGPAPEIVAIVGKIVAKLDAGVAAGHDPTAALNWFRSELQKAQVDASQADMATIKAVFLPKMPMPFLENIAKLMAIV